MWVLGYEIEVVLKTLRVNADSREAQTHTVSSLTLQQTQ